MRPGSAHIGPSTQVWLLVPSILAQVPGRHEANILGQSQSPCSSFPWFLPSSTFVPTFLPASQTFSPQPRPPAPSCMCVGGGGAGAQEGTCLCTRVGPPSLTSLPHLGVAKATLLSCRGTQGLGLFFRLGQLKPVSLDLGQPFLDLSPVLGDQGHHESGRNRKVECWG